MVVSIVKIGWIISIITLTSAVTGYETVEDAAILARKLVEMSPTSIATMATVYPADHPSLSGQAFPLQEYYASCHDNGSLTLLFLPISRHSQNILHSPKQSASMSFLSEEPGASRARVSLMGNVTIYRNNNNVPDQSFIKKCYLEKHPDARRWLPGGRDAPHVVYWARFDPQSIYFVGGFGDEHFIGYIPLKIYQDASSSSMWRNGRDLSVAGRVLVEQS